MNWISNFVRPKINAMFSRRETPENLWTKCDSCGSMLFHRELSDALNVCSNCHHHMYIAPRQRFINLFDGGLFTEIEMTEPSEDPLNFRDKKTIKIYLFHIFFNSIWSIIFFGFHQIFIALIDLGIILIFIIWLMRIYYQVNKISFLLMIPYLLWSSYALILNGAIFYLN